MGYTNLPNGATSFGIPLMGSGIQIPATTGAYFFVDSVHGANGNDGRTPTAALATVDAAINLCTADHGDVIVLMPGHAETVTATSIALDVAGVQVIGLGTGKLRPTFTYGAAAATITVSADDCSWKNTFHTGHFDNVAAAFTIGAAKDFCLENNDFEDESSVLHFLSIVVTGSSNNAADGLKVLNNTWIGLAAAPDAFISVLGNLSRLLVKGNYADMAATNDVGHFLTLSSKVLVGARISWNTLTVIAATGSTVGLFITGSATTCSGVVDNNYIYSLDVTAPLVATTGLKLAYFNNYVPVAADKSGAILPAIV